MNDYDIRLVSSMEKIMPKGGQLKERQIRKLTGFQGQRVSFQAAYCFHGDYYVNQTEEQAFRNPYVTVSVEGNFEGKVGIRKVECVPVYFPCEKKHDADYIGTEPGLYPDILSELSGGIQMIIEQWRALWIDCEIPEDAVGGDREIILSFRNVQGEIVAKRTLTLHIVAAKLPKQRLLHTEWFHPDCLADYYEVEPFSEKHWGIMRNFLEKAVERGCNMIFTCLFTPALDTLIGGDRTTVQLVQVKKENGTYQFDYTRFHRWIQMCKEIGFEYFEMSHLFAQWGAKFPPKVVAEVNGKEEQIFGWDTPVEEGEYQKFLEEFLPGLIKELEKEEILGKTYFHVSDEPTKYNADTYGKAWDIVRPYIGKYPVIDALSHVDLYEKGIVKKPVPTNDSIHEFLEQGLENAWVYYCCAQGNRVSNRYIAMPLWRARILGVQLYKYQMEGFLHWGYNFYNCQYSLHTIDPYRINDGEDAFPAGDPFIVYPGKDGKPVESMRLLIMEDAMLDVRILEMLESLTSREDVLKLIEDLGQMEIRFDQYPSGSDYLLELWETVSREIEMRL
nr:DUF4091 domain-containing protein [uncultured Merdimonas sp.]